MKEKIKVDCENCIFYEQKIKEKDQRIAELEEENSKMKKKLENPHDVWVENNTLTEINNWQNGEISRLHEQLKNAPKFKIGDEIYHIRNWNGEILKAKVKSISVRMNEYNTNFEYGLSDWSECETDKRYCNFVSSVADEEFVFATEAEAQKYLEELCKTKQ